MIQLIAIIIFLSSMLGIIFIMSRKIPVLIQLPQNGHHGIRKPKLISQIQERVKHHHFHLFEKQMLLHKILSWIKILILKTETKIDTLLHGIRKKAQELDKEIKKKK